jgi:hypothetical protein
MISRLRVLKRRRGAKREIAVIGQGLRALSALRRIAAEQGNEELYKLAAALQYCLVVRRDLLILETDVLTERDKWRRNLSARHLAVLLVEFSDKIDTVLGKEFRAHIVAAAGSNEKILKRYRSLRRSFADICEDFKKELRHIRNTAAAHHDSSDGRQIETIDNLDERPILVVAQAASMWLWLILTYWRLTVQKRFPEQWKLANFEGLTSR